MKINENRWPDAIRLGSPAADNYVRAYKYHDLPKFHDRQEGRKGKAGPTLAVPVGSINARVGQA